MELDKKIEISQKICDLYSINLYTIANCCENQGIPVKTFNNWKNSIAEIADLYKECQEKKRTVKIKKLVKMSLSALELLLTEREVEEKHTEVKINDDGTTKPATIKTIKRKVAPNSTVAIYVSKSLVPELKEKSDINLTGDLNTSKNKEIDLSNLSTEDIREWLRLKKKAQE